MGSYLRDAAVVAVDHFSMGGVFNGIRVGLAWFCYARVVSLIMGDERFGHFVTVLRVFRWVVWFGRRMFICFA